MSKARRLVASLLIAAGLSACGRPTATAETANAANGVVATENATVNVADAPAAAQAAPAQAQAVTALPLKRGYYVTIDTPCGQASNATVMLLRRDGIGGSRDFCEFKTIEQTGANSYRITEACGDFQDSGPREPSVTLYTLKGDTAFTSKSEAGWERSARYCAQSSMPADFRANDISDVTR